MGYPDPTSDNAKLAQHLARVTTFDHFAPKLIKEVIAQTKSELIKTEKIETDNPSIKKVAEEPGDKEQILSEEDAIRKARGNG